MINRLTAILIFAFLGLVAGAQNIKQDTVFFSEGAYLTAETPRQSIDLKLPSNSEHQNLILNLKIDRGVASSSSLVHVMVNNKTVGSCSDSICKLRLKTSGPQVQLDFYAGFQDLSCSNTTDPGFWVEVKSGSYISYAKKEKPFNPNFIAHALRNRTAFVIPDDFALQHQGLAANLLYKLEEEAERTLPVYTWSQIQDSALENYVFFGLFGQTPLELRNLIRGIEYGDRGIIELIQIQKRDSTGALIGEPNAPLLISGFTDESLETCVNACLSENFLSSLFVHQSDIKKAPSQIGVHNPFPVLALKELASSGGELRGFGRSSLNFRLNRGQLGVPSGKLQIQIHGVHGGFSSDENASLSLKLNGKTLKMISLSSLGGKIDLKANFESKDLMAKNTIQLVLETMPSSEACELGVAAFTAQIDLEASSVYYLNSGSPEAPRFAQFPGGLRTNQTTLVYSPSYGVQGIEMMRDIIRALNSNVGGSRKVFPGSINTAEYRPSGFRSDHKIFLVDRSDSLLAETVDGMFKMELDTLSILLEDEVLSTKIHRNELVAQIFEDNNRLHLAFLVEPGKTEDFKALLRKGVMGQKSDQFFLAKSREQEVAYLDFPLSSESAYAGKGNIRLLRFWSKYGTLVGILALSFFIIAFLYLNRNVFSKKPSS